MNRSFPVLSFNPISYLARHLLQLISAGQVLIQAKVLYPLSFNSFNVFKGVSAVLNVPSMTTLYFSFIALFIRYSVTFPANLAVIFELSLPYFS